MLGGERGSADTVRDPRGFAVKFYTEEGNWDLVGNNTPVSDTEINILLHFSDDLNTLTHILWIFNIYQIFFIRDPFLFPSFIHTQKRNPVTHLKDPEMVG